MAGFQSTVNQYPSPAVEGDFASGNPRQAMVVGENQLITGAAGVTLGRFAWADDNGVVSNAQPASGVARLGFAARDGQPGFINEWLQDASMVMPQGLPITLHTDADVWVRALGAAAIGNKAFASTTDGTVQPGVAGATVAGFVETAWYFVSDAAAGALACISTGG